jgi:hypothetical protein
MLPASWSGHVALAPAVGGEPEVVLDRLVAALLEQKAKGLQRKAGSVTFTGGVLRLVWSWNILVPISEGRVEAVRGPRGVELHYRIAFTEVVVIGTFFVGLAACFMNFGPGPDDWVVRFIVPVVMWLFVVGGNVALALVEFPTFLRRVGNRAA